jgi:hypothetical protein
MQSLPRRRQHRVRFIDRDHFLDERGEGLCDATGAAAEVGNFPPLVEQSKQGDIGATTEQLEPHPIPIARRRGEELLRFGVTSGEHGLSAAYVLFRGVGVHDLIAHQVPEAAARAVETVRGEAIVSARPLGARIDPAFGAQDLQMAADSRLRQLEDRLQLVYRQLITLQGEQQPAPRWIGERGHLAK